MLAFKATTAGLVYDGRILVEPWENGSKLTLNGDVYPSGPLKLMQPLLRRKLKRGIETEVSAVKAFLERRTTAAASTVPA